MDKNNNQKNKFIIECAGRCVKGNYREKNQDNFYIHGNYLDADYNGTDTLVLGSVKEGEIDVKPELIAVFDGMGGGEHGEIAACEAAKCSDEYMQNLKSVPEGSEAKILDQLCKEINRRVYDAAMHWGVSLMGSTMAALFFSKDKTWSCNVGDSRCYRVRAGVIEKLSEDHVEELYYIDMVKNNTKPGLIQYLGMDPDEIILEPSISSGDMSDKDTYLICSDGLTDMVAEADIVSIINEASNAEEAATKLVDMALENGGTDNITAIVCNCKLI